MHSANHLSSTSMSQAILLRGPGQVELAAVPIHSTSADDILVEVQFSSISSGTERLLWEGSMPQFPGMGYPLVPGYEAVGMVSQAPDHLSDWLNKPVFVPGTQCYGDVKGLFGASASRLLVNSKRAVLLPQHSLNNSPAQQSIANYTLLALAATAHHMIQVAGPSVFVKDAACLVVGHGVLGRLLARILKHMGAQTVLVSEINPQRQDTADAQLQGYQVVNHLGESAQNFDTIFEVSGDASQLDQLISRLTPGGQVVLGGFYPGSVQFGFAPAFMREAQIRIAAQWQPTDLKAVLEMVVQKNLSLENLLTHQSSPLNAAKAYEQAFGDSSCLKMVLDWSQLQ